MKHLIIRDSSLQGWAYGMLRAFEEAIIEETGAEIYYVSKESDLVRTKLGHGMRFGGMRRILPPRSIELDADVIWCVLMGPEDYRLDLYRDWMLKAKYRILYLFDTLDPQFPLIRRLFSNDAFNIKITSFSDAVPFLTELTGSVWRSIEQGVPENLFQPVPFEQRLIHFCSYGRRLPVFHDAVSHFCEEKGLYFDFTTHDGKHPAADPAVLYEQYSWHLRHSIFTVSWPVEVTSPERAGRLRPLTCRWFEAAASGTVMVGRKPDTEVFKKYFSEDAVIEIDPTGDSELIFKKLAGLWDNRESYLRSASDMRSRMIGEWSWNKRVREILADLKDLK